MALYPNAVIVKMDRQKGEVWVKDKFTGAVICVKLSDLQNPKEPGNDGERSSPAGPKNEAPAQPATPAPPPVRTLPPEP
mgnify:CR=1 FL=1